MAAGRNLNAKFILSLRDGVSSGPASLKRQLDGLAGNARRIGLMGAGVAALSFAGPIQSAAAYDTGLRDLANTHSLSGAAAEDFIRTEGRRVEQLARQYRMLSRDLMSANNVLAANAIEEPDRIRLLPEVARLAVAERVAADDAAKLGAALLQVSHVPMERIGRAFAMITQAGRLGAVEIRDMAGGFPALLTAAAGVGMTGERGIIQLTAALEVAKRGAADASTAMNNLRNVFAKMTSEETMKNFAQVNVDWPAVMRDAERQGISALDALLQKLREKTGNDPFKLSALFADMQAVEGLRPILQHVQAMLTMREQIAQADTGILDAGLALRMQGWESQMTATQEAGEQLSRRLGTGLAPSLGLVNIALFALVDGFDWMEARFPGLLGNVLGIVGGITLLVGALGAAVPLFGFIAAGVGLLVSPLGLVALAAAAVAVVGLHIWRNWGTIGPKLSRMWQDRSFPGCGRTSAASLPASAACWRRCSSAAAISSGAW